MTIPGSIPSLRLTINVKEFAPLAQTLFPHGQRLKSANILPKIRRAFDTVHTVEGLDFELLPD
jgi:hypothetical protein